MKNKIKEQLHGNYLRLSLILTLASLLVLICNQITVFIFAKGSIELSLFSILASLIGTIIMNTSLLSILCTTRGVPYNTKVLKASLIKIPYYIVCTFLLSLIQLGVNMLFIFTAYIPLLNSIISVIISIFFLLWNAFIVFQLYDNEVRLMTILFQPFRILSKKWKECFLYSLPIILWMLIGAQLLILILSTYISDPKIFNQMLLAIDAVYQIGGLPVLIVIVTYIVFYFIQFVTLVPAYLQVMNFYEESRGVVVLK